jgi:hypothetical protein
MEGIDPRLIVKIGKETIMRNPCVGECAGCPKQFKPTPYEGKTYCEVYLWPAAKWTGKTCPFLYKPKPESESGRKVNPLKASKRGVSQQVAPAAGSKE